LASVEPSVADTGPERPLRVLVLALVVALVWVLTPLAGAILVGGFIAVALYGAFEWLVRRLRGRRTLASSIATLVVVAAIFVPVGVIAWKTVVEASAGIAWIVQQVRALGGLRGLGGLLPASVQRMLPSLEAHLSAEIAAFGERAAAIAPQVLAATGRLFALAFLAVVTLFYLFRQGPELVDFVRRTSPLRPEHTETLLAEGSAVARGLFWGNLVTAACHGFFGAIGYAIVGLPHVFFLGALTLVASFIPAIGTAIVWVPIAAALWLTGNHGGALLLLVWGVVVIGGIDHLLRPVFARGKAQLPTLLMFLTIFGGISVFGLKGLLLGPLIGGLALSALRLVARPAA
jgi:predicted PurR-regulated permease PerM